MGQKLVEEAPAFYQQLKQANGLERTHMLCEVAAPLLLGARGFFGRGGRAVSREVMREGGESAVETLANRALNQVSVLQDEITATNPNAAAAIARKYRALEGAQNSAIKTETLSDGRIRYYEKEKLARTTGPTRGTSYVTEYNPNTGDVRTWMESYDHLGSINRIHPKMYNGQTLNAPHYPPTLKDKLESEYYSGYRR